MCINQSGFVDASHLARKRSLEFAATVIMGFAPSIFSGIAASQWTLLVTRPVTASGAFTRSWRFAIRPCCTLPRSRKIVEFVFTAAGDDPWGWGICPAVLSKGILSFRLAKCFF